MSIKPCHICEDKHECQFEQWEPCKESIEWEELSPDDTMAGEKYVAKGISMLSLRDRDKILAHAKRGVSKPLGGKS